MKRALPFLVFVLVSAPLTWFWMEQGFRIYGDFLKTIAPSFFDAALPAHEDFAAQEQQCTTWLDNAPYGRKRSFESANIDTGSDR